MAENGFGQGVDLGLRMFGAMQNASYMQQLQQNAADANARQQEELQLRQQQFAAQQEQRALEMDRWVLDHPNEFSVEAKLQATNSMNRRIAGPNARPITQLALDTFDADLRGFPAKLASAPDRQAQLSLMAEMEAKSRENPYFAKAFDLRKPVFEQVMSQQGSLETAKALYGELLDPAQLNRFAKMDPKVITKIFDDKDMNKAFVSRHVQQNLQDLLSGARQFSDAAVRDTLAAARSVGFDLGPDGEKVLKAHDTYASYNQSAEQLTKIRQTLTPLFDAVKASPDVKNLIDVSGKVQADAFAGAAATGNSPFGGLAYAKAHLDAADRRNAVYDGFLQKNPAIAQSLQELTPQAVSRMTQIDRQMQDLERRRELVERDKLRPNRDMDLNLYDRQLMELRREAMAWKPFVEYARTPNIESLAHVLRSGKTLDRSLKEVSTLRDTALTASDRLALDTSKREWTKANTEKATHDAELKLNAWVAVNPEADENVIRGKAAEFAQQAKDTYGVAPDVNKVVDTFVTKKSQQTQILSSDERQKVAAGEANIITADSLLKDFDASYVGGFDNTMNSLRAKLPEGSPEFLKLSEHAQEYRQRAQLYLTQYRNKIFGASLSQNEQKDALGAMANLDMGDDQFKAALKEMKRWEQIATERIKSNAAQFGPGKKPVKGDAPTAPASGEKSFDAYRQWKHTHPSGTVAEFMGS